jgi:hypothetical protein
MANLRNLSRRPAKPALGNGRVQRGALRALWVLGIASTSEIAEWTHARARAYGELSDNHTLSARRALDRIADRVKRVPPYGAWLWRLRNLTTEEKKRVLSPVRFPGMEGNHGKPTS